MKRVLVSILLGSALLTGCASRQYIDQPFSPVSQKAYDVVRYWPVTGRETTTQIGEPMIKAYVVTELPSLSVERPIQFVTLYREGLRMMLEIDPGMLELAGHDAGGGKYFVAEKGIRLTYDSRKGFVDPETLPGGIHVSASGATSIYWFWDDATREASLTPAPGIGFKQTTRERPPRDPRYQRELIYAGRTPSTVSVLYRESINDHARPAFSQDLSYLITSDRVIGYKGARLEILNTGNTSITYRVITPLEYNAELR